MQNARFFGTVLPLEHEARCFKRELREQGLKVLTSGGLALK